MDTKIFDDWSVQLAGTYKPGMVQEGEWFSISQKINGTRCTYFAGNLISRTGHQFLGLDHILNELMQLSNKLGISCAFDGELRLKEDYIQNITDNDAFKIGNGIAMQQRDFAEKSKLKFIIFDIIDSHEWAYENSNTKYKSRSEGLKSIQEFIVTHGYNHISVVPIVYSGYDIRAIEDWSNYAYEVGWEGIMINKDALYQYKRTNKLLKYKKFNTIDLRVVGTLEGVGKYQGVLGALVCKYYENTVAVGTGFDDFQRDSLWQQRQKLIGKIIEVKYKDITCNKDTGLASLQFPVFKGFKLDKEEPDA